MAFTSKSFTASQADYVLVPCSQNEMLTVYRATVYTHNGNTVNTQAVLSFGTGGEKQEFTGHDGIDAGSGFVEISQRDSPIAEGRMGQSLTFTCGTPTSGSIRVNVSYDRNVFNT